MAAAYIRVSTDEQADHGISIPAQKSRLIAYCQAQGWDLYDFFIDEGYSGKDLNRPAVKRLLEEAGENKFDAVVVLKLDRLSRRQKDVLYLLEDVFEPLRIGFKSVTETFDTTTPFGKAALGMMAVFAQLERETIVERVKLAKKESARQGRFMGGPAPFGYLYNTEKKCLEIEETAAQTIRWIYEAYQNLGGYQIIALELERRSVPGPLNLRWSKNYIRKILTNPVYAGLIGHKGDLYPGRHPHIIDPGNWHEVQAVIRSRGSSRSAPVPSSGLISGIIWCGQCGARMRVKNVWQNYPGTQPKKIIRYYVCYSQDGSARHMVREPGCKCGYKNADEIEKKVISQLMSYSFQKAILKQGAEELLEKSTGRKTHGPILLQASKELALLEKKLERLYSALEMGSVEPDDLTVRIKYIRERKKYLQGQIERLEFTQREDADRRPRAEELIAIMQDFPAIWEEAAPGERREIIVNLVKAVRVYQNSGVQLEFFSASKQDSDTCSHR